MIDLERGVTDEFDAATRREWLVTNGLGGYASGTVGGPRTRCYHGLLVAATDPPLGRTLLVSHVDETVRYDDRNYALATHEWDDGTVAPRGLVHLDHFHLEGTVPVWTYACGDALLEKRVWMEQGEHTTYVQYRLARAQQPMTLRMNGFVNHRSHHATTEAGDWNMDVTSVDDGVHVQAYDDATPIFLRSDTASIQPAHTWYRDVHLATEAARGLTHRDDSLHAATAEAQLSPGEDVTLTFSTGADAPLDGSAARARRAERDDALVTQADLGSAPPDVQHLARSADQFVVARPTEDNPDGQSIIAGYPWFGDWGRDTMIALPGLTLATGRADVAAQILRTYGQYVDRGMIPNRFPGAGETPEYNTVDATLWYVEAIRAYVDATGDTALLNDLWPVLTDVVDGHEHGTRHQIQVDPDDGLLRAGEPGVQLTWMDAKVGDWVVTPRVGKPVEVNALWYNALRSLAQMAEAIDQSSTPYTERAEQVAAHFDRFWTPDRTHCYDVIDGPDGDDPSLRPNQLLAVSLPHSPLSASQQKAVVDACAAHLYTPLGLRSLAPDHPEYEGTYAGGRTERDGAYHQGTVWSWLVGPFVKAHLRVYEDPERARTFLAPLRRHLSDHGLGSVSEVFDGDPPFTPGGTPAQAWGVAQLLEAWIETEDALPVS